MSRGKIRCSGSGLFLKSQFGVGYTMTVRLKDKIIVDISRAIDKKNQIKNKSDDDDKEDNSKEAVENDSKHTQKKLTGLLSKEERIQSLRTLVKSHINDSKMTTSSSSSSSSNSHPHKSAKSPSKQKKQHQSMIEKNHLETILSQTTSTELEFLLPMSQISHFPALFKRIESKETKAKLGLCGFGVSCPTLEEVFLNIHQLDLVNNDDDKEEENADVKRVDGSVIELETLKISNENNDNDNDNDEIPLIGSHSANESESESEQEEAVHSHHQHNHRFKKSCGKQLRAVGKIFLFHFITHTQHSHINTHI